MPGQTAADGSGAAQMPLSAPKRGLFLPERDLKLRDFHDRLRVLLADPRLRIYIDTSLLMWLLRISSVARREFLDWCGPPDGPRKVFVTTWCAHELYRHLKDERVLKQIRDRLFLQKSTLEDVVRFADQSYDDAVLATTDFANKSAAIESLRNSVGFISKNLRKYIDNAMKPAYSDAESDLRLFVNTHSVWTESTKIVAAVNPEFLNRAEGRLPPGFQDEDKEENAFGDFVFWREVLSHAEACPVLILTNDCKADWIHPVSKIENYDGRPLGRTPHTGVDAQMPHPYLTFEAEERGIPRLEVLNMGNLALFLEMERPESAKVLVSAAYPRGIEDECIPNWASMGIPRPLGSAATSLESVTLSSIRSRSTTQSQTLSRILRALRGSREEVQDCQPQNSFPALLPILSSVEIAVLGKAFFRPIAIFPGINTFAEVMQAAGEAYAPAQAALYLGMLLGIYLSNTNEVRRTPGGELAQGIFELFDESYAAPALTQLNTILEAENVWLPAPPTAAPESVLVTLSFEDGLEAEQSVSSISVGSNEILDATAAASRTLQIFFPVGQCSVHELLRLIARQFTIPLRALATESRRDKVIRWQEGAGIGMLRTDLRKVATDLEVLLEDTKHE